MSKTMSIETMAFLQKAFKEQYLVPHSTVNCKRIVEDKFSFFFSERGNNLPTYNNRNTQNKPVRSELDR